MLGRMLLFYRNIGFGTCSVLARIGAAVAPQLVYMVSLTPSVQIQQMNFYCRSSNIRKRTFGHVRPAKIPVSLCIRAI